MSKDETGTTESQGIPGYSANSSIPGGFTLPIPTATAAAGAARAGSGRPVELDVGGHLLAVGGVRRGERLERLGAR